LQLLDLVVFGGESASQGGDDGALAAGRRGFGRGGLFAVLVDDRDEVGVFVHGLALHSGTLGDGGDVDRRVGFT
jgi:hypothetical protein